MASFASSSPTVDFKWIGLLLLAVASIHCQVRNSGLSGAVGDARAPGGGGSPAGYADAGPTGGQGPGPTSGAGGAQGASDLRLGSELGGAESGLAGASGNAGLDGGTGATDGGGTVVLDGAASDGRMLAEGGAGGSGGVGGGTGAGGSQGGGGTTGLGGSLDADTTAVDTEPPDSPVGADVEPVVGDDVASDEAGSPDDVADAPAPPPPDTADGATIDIRPAWTLLWEDNFDGAANSGIDTTKWSYVIWPAGQVNNEQQRYTDSRQNVFLDGDGHLVLRGLRSGAQYTSGRIQSNAQFKFGRVEVSAKLPAGRGSFPGIVMLGSGSWPQSGEIGLMEQYGQPNDKSWFYASAYADSSAGSGDKRNIRYDFPDDTAASNSFHVYSVDWYADHLVLQVDGDEVMRTSFAASSPFYTTPESIVLDVALGGDMGGTIDTTAFPMDMVVDYVRVYAF
jgi:beta-glucanase (GH16 family)